MFHVEHVRVRSRTVRVLLRFVAPTQLMADAAER